MTALPNSYRNTVPAPPAPDVAWRLWKALNTFSEALWDAYEQEFLDYCSEECEELSVSIDPDPLELPF